MTVITHHRYADIQGHRLFYREAGPSGAPTVVLLHGFPASSSMFRHLIPELADRWHVIAPDLLGFGESDAPAVDEFDYSFDALADLTRRLLDHLGVRRYAIYVQDYGAPIGWRLALAEPAAITAVISQNGNAYEEGFVPEFLQLNRNLWDAPGPATEAPLRQALALDFTRHQYLAGVTDPTLVDPGTWRNDYALLSRPGMDLVHMQLFRDYATNVKLYPEVQRWFREWQVPLLAVWGQGDPMFRPRGAYSFTSDLPAAEIHLLEGGHFLLESALGECVPLIRKFLAEAL
ncbi:alpha/beta hydrolase [Actinoplanes sp. NBRC 101535]|uniref:alpha/beta fold hydrolase n=1 Tax=Actinoplanes sp. NBRC 101535 TaxID=3032196 RepID=UPI0024A4E905|nr:alpha/beta hydrolase [Actinoplanes sp. NBRC 101535]GLY02455.1 hydrolase [Actinoplanes sp. NBRC 101535]